MRITPMLAAATALVLLTGCRSGRVQDRMYLRAVKIDLYGCGFSFFSEDDEVLEVSGGSVAEAVRSAETILGKEIFTGHTELAVIGDGCDRDELLSMLFSEWRVSPSCIVLYGDESISDPEETVGSVRLRTERGELPCLDLIARMSETETE